MDLLHCPECGTELELGLSPSGLCPQCLLKLGLDDRLDQAETDPSDFDPSLAAGQEFGSYLIIRLLDKGGMGEVYEAEHSESGRRVALKVIGHRLTSEKDRRRFLREGRLAASINHPNSIYIYGTEEIEGVPAIAMELTPGGTLKDRVEQEGPLSSEEAVDAILQVIKGLESASAQGVLHRDVKPSNCFVDSEGVVKVGDFGLAISTVGREETQLTSTGAVLGTPVFASPEQLRGEELDVRSDIYSVGATLFFLLTGETPFKGEGNVQLIAKILDQKPDSPSKLQPEIPKELSQVALRCMHKERSRRYDGYQALRQVLLPFGSHMATAASLGSRYVAGAMDFAILLLTWAFISLLLPDLSEVSRGASFLLGFTLVMFYFAVPESWQGASIGKALCGLQVTGPSSRYPSLARSLFRSLVFVVVLWLSYLLLMAILAALTLIYPAVGLTGWASVVGVGLIALALLLITPMILFIPSSPSNAFAGLHELASQTRVVVRSKLETRVAVESHQLSLLSQELDEHFGPYLVLTQLRESEQGTLFLGYDDRLRRRVWIQTCPAGTAAVTAIRRDLSRSTRLRWLGGRRKPDTSWDAYEAPEGKAFLDLVGKQHSWIVVRRWLLDLAQEMDAGRRDRSLPGQLKFENLWITSSGRLKLVDFPVPRRHEGPADLPHLSNDVADFPRFIMAFAQAALEGVVAPLAQRDRPALGPLPLHASQLFQNIGDESFDDTVENLRVLATTEPVVTRWRRFAHLTCCALLILFPTASTAFMQIPADMEPLRLSLLRYEQLLKLSSEESLEELAALEIYIAGRFGETISDPAVWFGSPAHEAIRESLRTLAEQIYKRHPRPSAQEISGATQTLQPFLRSVERQTDWLFQVLVVAMGGLALGALIGCLSGFFFRGGVLFRLLGIRVVSEAGFQVTRLRSFYRSFLAWSPGLCCLLIFPLFPWSGPMARSVDERWFLATVVSLVVTSLIAGAIWAVVSPHRLCAAPGSHPRSTVACGCWQPG
jgi:eukaryotic-like serine/threonine-protein kinase